MIDRKRKILSRQKRKARVKKCIQRVSDNPRLSVFKSAKHIYAQVIDDSRNVTIATASTLNKELKEKICGLKGKVEPAKEVGKLIGKILLEKGIDKVTFDRNGFLYHGRVAAIAEGAREAGLKF